MVIIKRHELVQEHNLNLYAAVSAPVAATRDGVLKRLRDIRGRVTNLYNKVRGPPPQKTLVMQRKADKERGWKTSSTCMVVRKRAGEKRGWKTS